jgi:hypothetical protein
LFLLLPLPLLLLFLPLPLPLLDYFLRARTGSPEISSSRSRAAEIKRCVCLLACCLTML